MGIFESLYTLELTTEPAAYVQSDIQGFRSGGGVTTTKDGQEEAILKQICSKKNFEETSSFSSPFWQAFNVKAIIPLTPFVCVCVCDSVYLTLSVHW